jgi:DNA-binding HxlR family transcriptional regulator
LRSAANTKVSYENAEQSRPTGPRRDLRELGSDGHSGIADEDRRQVDTFLVLSLDLLGGRARFSELERAVPGISERMLSSTLKNLERDGLVIRELFPEVPPRVEYEITTWEKAFCARAKDWSIGPKRTGYRSGKRNPNMTQDSAQRHLRQCGCAVTLRRER